MKLSTSVLEDLLRALPQARPQLYFKSSLTALSHAMEDLVLAGSGDQPLVIASFQKERFYRQEAHRYERIAALTQQVYVLAAPETSFTSNDDPSFASLARDYDAIAFDPTDKLSEEWHLVVLGEHYATCLICQERFTTPGKVTDLPAMDQTRRFEGIWTFDRAISEKAAEILLDRILLYRPDLQSKIQQAQARFFQSDLPSGVRDVDADPFAQRLVTYIQASQYKLQKAYRAIAARERRERLINSMTAAIRRTLNPDEIFRVAVAELGQATFRQASFGQNLNSPNASSLSTLAGRCLIYPCQDTSAATEMLYESLAMPGLKSLSGQIWTLDDHPLFQWAAQRQESLAIDDLSSNWQDQFDLAASEMIDAKAWRDRIQTWQIRAWLLVPILYQGRLMGMVELHYCQPDRDHHWSSDDIAMVEAIATQLGVALIQAEAYANLEKLNEQLAALEQTRSNLIAITGHELRTPLSTIQVCLESLVSEPDMMPELQQVMLQTALTDAERMRKLIQDFLTLSRLESGRVEWHLEAISLTECVELALSSIRARFLNQPLPKIRTDLPPKLPSVQADGEWLVEVLTKLLDNACKFSKSTDEVVVRATTADNFLEITVADTGCGIEPEKLEVVFDRFYQEEGFLRRTVGGTGLGLAISRQIVQGLGGQIWAKSEGRDRGSQFHFTLPLARESRAKKSKETTERSPRSPRRTTISKPK